MLKREQERTRTNVRKFVDMNTGQRVHKPKKGKGAFKRKDKHREDYSEGFIPASCWADGCRNSSSRVISKSCICADGRPYPVVRAFQYQVRVRGGVEVSRDDVAVVRCSAGGDGGCHMAREARRLRRGSITGRLREAS